MEFRGRVSQVRRGELGRFGWRAQLPNLREFVLSACANELGLEVEGHSQARNPMEKETRLGWPEISTRDTNAMVKFVGEIKSPKIDAPDHLRESAIQGFKALQRNWLCRLPRARHGSR